MDTGPTAEPTTGTSDRVTVNLTPRAARALAEIVAITGDNKTDSVNRALQVYSYVEQALKAGGDVFIRRGDDGQQEQIHVV